MVFTLKGKCFLLRVQIFSIYSGTIFRRGLVWRKANEKSRKLSALQKGNSILQVYAFLLIKAFGYCLFFKSRIQLLHKLWSDCNCAHADHKLCQSLTAKDQFSYVTAPISDNILVNTVQLSQPRTKVYKEYCIENCISFTQSFQLKLVLVHREL